MSSGKRTDALLLQTDTLRPESHSPLGNATQGDPHLGFFAAHRAMGAIILLGSMYYLVALSAYRTRLESNYAIVSGHSRSVLSFLGRRIL